MKSYIQAILGAEYILKMLPVGTHDHAKFIKPSELIHLTEQTDLTCFDALGIKYNPFTQIFSYTESLDVNYMIVCQKSAS